MEAAALRAVGSSSMLHQFVGVSMLKKSMDVQSDQMAKLLSGLPPVSPNVPVPASVQIGANLDISV